MPKRARVFRYDPATDSVVEAAANRLALRAKWPIELDSLSVLPAEVAAHAERDRQCGVPTEYTPEGRPVMTGPGHYKRYRKLNGVHFRNGYES